MDVNASTNRRSIGFSKPEDEQTFPFTAFFGIVSSMIPEIDDKLPYNSR